MARLKGTITPETVKKFKGSLDIYFDKNYGWIARKWPRRAKPTPTPAWLQSVANMKRAALWTNQLVDYQRQPWKQMASRSQMTWKDACFQSVMRGLPGDLPLAPILGTEVTRLTRTTVRVDLMLQHWVAQQPPTLRHHYTLWAKSD